MEVLLALRLLLDLTGANPLAGFSVLVYLLSEPFLLPFVGLFPASPLGDGVLEPAALMALGIYTLLAWGLARAVWPLADLAFRPSE